MNISEQQLNNMMAAVSVALQPLVRVVPMTPVEWADQNYYLPKESSYGEGEWKTLPFQIAIMNCMGNDQVRTVTWRATLHIEVFLPAQVPDSELDSWMESRIYPAMTAIPALVGLITTMVTQGYDYRRDDDMALWSSADLTYSITYEM